MRLRFVSLVVLIGALAITWFRDIHGPPALFGFALASLLRPASGRPVVQD
jgi:hypothetical protein